MLDAANLRQAKSLERRRRRPVMAAGVKVQIIAGPHARPLQQQPTQSSDVNVGTRDHSTPDSHQWRERLRLVFGFDPRSLALFRVLLGLLILTDLILRSRDLTKNYTDLGVLPRDAPRYALFDRCRLATQASRRP